MKWLLLAACSAFLALRPLPAWAEAPASPASAASVESWHRLVGILQYLEADYPGAVESAKASELEEQRAFVGEALAAAADIGAPMRSFEPRLAELKSRIDAGVDPEGVRRDAAALVEELVLEGGLSRSPRRPPALARGAAVYQAACAACHGASGDGQVPIAAAMSPRPTSFQNPEVMDLLTPYKAFNVVSFGVTGTPMPSFSALEEDDRWAVAFYLFTLRQKPCTVAPLKASLEQLATSTDVQLSQRFGASAVACLRTVAPSADEERALLTARAGIERALRLAQEGHPEEAREGVVDAYLRGLEPVEPLLRARDPKQVEALEAAFRRTRLAAETRSPTLGNEGRALLGLIDQARKSDAGEFWTMFWASALILLREGFEASVILASLLAVLKKMGRPDQARLVHLGWVSAAAVGAASFLFARELFAGANREWLEGLMSLFAVGMLVYAALWLNARTNVRKLMGSLRGKMLGALDQGSALGLFVISFTAMLRESLETAVFLQGLAVDSFSGTLWGAAAGLTGLLCLVLFVRKVGYRLPMKALFRVSTVVLVATAWVLLGKGLHSLQEVGALPLRPLSFVRVDFLGLYPDAVSLLPQLLFALAPLGWWWLRRKVGLRPADGTVAPSPPRS